MPALSPAERLLAMLLIGAIIVVASGVLGRLT